MSELKIEDIQKALSEEYGTLSNREIGIILTIIKWYIQEIRGDY